MGREMKKAPALAEFDRSRDEFLAALDDCPDASLTFLKEGDDYALGGLAVHCNLVLRRYRRVLDRLAAGDAEGFRAADPPAEVAEADRRSKAGLAPRERESELRLLGTLHGDVMRVALGIPDEAWERRSNVFYGAAEEAYPTSPDDLVGWLRDHYREHVPHAAALVAEWRSSQAG